MSYVLNDPVDFAEESAAGFAAAYPDLVRPVPGGVVRASGTPRGHVAVVVGGGSGHYPAFAGLVGPGLAHAAAMGNVFASPSAQQVHDVALAAEAGGGVLLGYGNYAGDVLNFDRAEAQLREAGIPARTVRVTDDIYSAPRDQRDKRRGVAGDLAVFRAAAWAAEQGWELDRVADVAARANERTRSLGIAFTGCTLPGADEPLFTVPAGQMGVGMGIHGEPGLDVRPLLPASALAELLVTALLDERPDDIPSADGARVAVIVNGLGSVKSEELFVVYGAVQRLLTQHGLVIVQPDVGEYATSFEMAGLSLTLLWLDDELERAWTSPAYTPAYRKGVLDPAALESPTPTSSAPSGEATDAATATAESVAAGRIAAAALAAIRRVIDDAAAELGRLDAIAGDGDHGIGMQRGARAAAEVAAEAVDAGAGAGSVLARAGAAWAHRAGGTSGALWGAGLQAVGARLGDVEAPDAATAAEALVAARDVVQDYGKAEVGDKTLVDALVPFVAELRERTAAGERLAVAWGHAATAASTAAADTAALTPRLGRARPHAAKSIGTPDPGAISFALAMTAVGEVLAAGHTQSTEDE
ncbi:dihydroxyacetone kinase family protein [Microbacterium sp. SORGH_AS_0888]|uniref:dihydroxyacetone kinase family protein n=1 Tax=Microbacterium sp. SORGH_AS_0888 TaxID=3041791 RepID=UPI0027880121|nr:dihydroxyacetone kinase family protein [Microbacterium sp. SORGH_AS_0888]MDQ1130051.1 dihydroxyacetone kinase [Microbacterium sp. SORGH_AS_0888]